VAMTISSKKTAPPSRSASLTPAAAAILDVAERLAQTRGYNGFSYADIATQLRVTKASLHYHFPSKAELGRALIERYRSVFSAALDAIDQEGKKPHEKLKQYVELYNSVMSNERMCLCGMLAAEYATLPAPMQSELTAFFNSNETWLTSVLEAGLRAGSFQFREPASERARVLIGALEGAMLVARSYGSPHRFETAAACVLADLSSVIHAKQPRTDRAAASGRARRK
jgi:TetR/AcrR family transcriptional regulator, transcriptional repressor for nem operon